MNENKLEKNDSYFNSEAYDALFGDFGKEKVEKVHKKKKKNILPKKDEKKQIIPQKTPIINTIKLINIF